MTTNVALARCGLIWRIRFLHKLPTKMELITLPTAIKITFSDYLNCTGIFGGEITSMDAQSTKTANKEEKLFFPAESNFIVNKDADKHRKSFLKLPNLAIRLATATVTLTMLAPIAAESIT